jgi:hypothetical protein
MVKKTIFAENIASQLQLEYFYLSLKIRNWIFLKNFKHDGLLSVEKIKTIFQNFTKLVKSCKFKMAEKFNMADFLRKT